MAESKEKEGSGVGGLGVLLIFVGLYVFFVNIIRWRSPSILFKIAVSLVTAVMVLSGCTLAIYAIQKERWGTAPAIFMFFVVSTALYILMFFCTRQNVIRDEKEEEERAAAEKLEDEAYNERMAGYERNIERLKREIEQNDRDIEDLEDTQEQPVCTDDADVANLIRTRNARKRVSS